MREALTAQSLICFPRDPLAKERIDDDVLRPILEHEVVLDQRGAEHFAVTRTAAMSIRTTTLQEVLKCSLKDELSQAGSPVVAVILHDLSDDRKENGAVLRQCSAG